MRRDLFLCVALAGCSGTEGPQGPAGQDGPRGEPGVAGPPGPAGTSALVLAVGTGSTECVTGGAELELPDGGLVFVCNGASGPQGPQGLQGAQGVQGLAGTPGTNGTSVVASSEPPGVNCPAGGARFVTSAGTTFACNGSNAPGYTAGSGLNLSGTVFSAAFTSVGGDNGSATTVARGDHLHDARYQPKLFTTLVLSPIGTPTQNGDLLRSTVDGISDNSAAKPYLIKLEPGLYDLGFNPYHGKPYIDLEGSGRATTVVEGSPAAVAVVGMVGPSEVRELTVVHKGGVVIVYAVSLTGAGAAARRVTVSGTSGSSATAGFSASGAGEIDIEDCDASATSHLAAVAGIAAVDPATVLAVRRVRVWGTGTTSSVTAYGLQSAAGSTTVEDSTFTATGGIVTNGVAISGSAPASLRAVSASSSSTLSGAAVSALLLDTAVATVEGGIFSASATGGASSATALGATSANWTLRGSLLQSTGPTSTAVSVKTSGGGAFIARIDAARVIASGGGVPMAAVVQPTSPDTALLSIAGSQVVGLSTASAPGATLRCVSDYDGNDATLNGACN